MLFERAAIVGLGLIGGSLAGAFKKYKTAGKIIGISRSDAYLRAKKAGLIDEGYPLAELESAIRTADLVVLALPIRKICALIPEVLPMVKKGCVITDVGSTKHVINELAETFRVSGRHFIGGHPMAGSEKKGFENGHPDLFVDRPYAIVPGESASKTKVKLLQELVSKIGAKPILVDSITHDRIAAGISHLPQIVATALINVLGRENESDNRIFELTGPALSEMTRIASSDISMWQDILVSNNRNISTMIGNLTDELKQMQKSLAKPSIRDKFISGNLYRKHLLNVEGVD